MGSKYPKPLTLAEKRNCVFEQRYRQINAETFQRVGSPEIEVPRDENLELVDCVERYENPDVHQESPSSRYFTVRVWDSDAIGRYTEDGDVMLGDSERAARRCDEAIRQTFGAETILDQKLKPIWYEID
jgi:hypothetical protein